MRLGNNPNKDTIIAPLPRVVVLVITHLPEMVSGYHRERFELIRYSISSLIANIGKDINYSLVFWDNGSFRLLRDWLVDIFTHPNKVILSPNIGKTNALKSVMRMLTPDTILAYGDDDMEYFPNWLAPQIEILETYPNVGMVTGYPVRITGKWGVDATMEWANNAWMNNDWRYDKARHVPDEWERDYCESVGRDYDQYKALTWADTDYRITYKGMQAYAMSQHCQFVCYPEVVEPLIEWTDRAMQDEIPFDKAVDAVGLLRLSTVERYTRHMGNVLERV